MDTVKDFISDLKSRVSNPLIISFLISWLLWNYKLTIGFLYYDLAELKSLGFISHLDLINKNYDIYRMYILPIECGIAYVIIFPFIKAQINLHDAKVTAKNDTKILEATKAGKMPVLKFVEMKESYDKTVSNLELIIANQSVRDVENSSLKEKISANELIINLKIQEIANLIYEINAGQEFGSHLTIQGKWTVRTDSSNSSNKLPWIITGDKVKLDNLEFHIRAYVANIQGRRISFLLVDSRTSIIKTSHYFLTMSEDGTTMKGEVDFNTAVFFEAVTESVTLNQ